MGLFRRLFGKPQAYRLNCLHCGFAHHIPAEYHDADVSYSVNCDEVRTICVYGPFTLTLEVKEFLKLEPDDAAGRVLSASIGNNMRALHDHMLSHADILFPIVQQSSQETNHKYGRLPPESRNPFVRYRKGGGVDVVGYEDLNLSKAQIPGITDRPQKAAEEVTEYFQCDHASAELLCTDNACPCGVPGAKIPVNTGYLISSFRPRSSSSEVTQERWTR